MYKYLLSSILLLPLACEAAITHLTDLRKPTLFHSSEHYEHNYPILAGPILYQAISNENYSEGYYPSKVIPFSGTRRTRIFDYDKHLSVDFILNRFSASLRQQGYTAVYECMMIDCGATEAFPSLFGRHMDSHDDRYGYTLFTRTANSNDMISVYAALIDSEVRVTVNLLGSSTDRKYVDLRLDGHPQPIASRND